MAYICLAFTATLSATAVSLIRPILTILAQHKGGASPSLPITSWLSGPTPTPAPEPIDISQLFPDDSFPLNAEQHGTFGEPVAFNVLTLIAIAYLTQPASKLFKNCILDVILCVFDILYTAPKAVCNILRAAVPVLDHRLRVSDIFVLIEVGLIFLFVDNPILCMPQQPFTGTGVDNLRRDYAPPGCWSSYLIKTAFTALVMALMTDLNRLRTPCRIFTHFLAAALIVKLVGGVNWDRLFNLAAEQLFGPEPHWVPT